MIKIVTVAVSFAAVTVGLFLPWASFEFADFGRLGANGPIQEMGLIIAVVAALGAFPNLSGSRDPRVPGTILAVFGFLISGLTAWTIFEILSGGTIFPPGTFRNVQPGVGLFVTLAGGVLMMISAVTFLGTRSYGPPLPRSDTDTLVPPGWYPNPDRSSSLRYWTGSEWTNHRVSRQ
jgi:hypothetical protein